MKESKNKQPLLKNYMDLITRVDEHIQRLARVHKDRLACKKGCDACCRHLSLFPVEAFALSRAFSRLEAPCREKIVITSYSIHYTKLYEAKENNRSWRQ